MFVFDEAHLLFDDAPPALQQRIEQVVRLIRSKGVGVYFCSQFPDDVPDNILGQLGNRVQHALRAFTPRDQKAVKTAAETFVAQSEAGRGAGDLAARRRRSAGVDAAGQGRADAGRTHADRAAALPHGRDHRGRTRARCAPAARSAAKYDTAVDRESASEMLAATARRRRDRARPPRRRPKKPRAAPRRQRPRPGGEGRDVRHQAAARAWSRSMAKQAARTVGSQVGRQILRGVLGGIFGGRR